jgi:PhzF family phenazine biosynthesis protein
MDTVEVWRMNAFTDQPFSGNPAGVVLDGDALSEEQMRLVAPQLNTISETVYVCSPTEPTADLRLRYFTTSTEVDLCGHATIAALFALAASGRLPAGGDDGVIRAQTLSGVLDLGVEFVDGQLAWACMTQPVARHALPSCPEHAADVLGLDPAQIRRDLPIACANTGIWSCYVPLIDLDALAAVDIDRDRIAALWPDNADFAGVYPFVLLEADRNATSVAVRSRFFSPPKFGIVEDPVTGTASGALAAYLIREGVMSSASQLKVQQGVEMGSPGSVEARQLPGGEVEIRGRAVPIYRGQLLL